MLFAELRRRNVFKVATAYMVVGWIVLQISSQFFENFGAPDWAIRSFSLLIVLGFPITCLVAWAFESTSEGIVRSSGRTTEHAETHWYDYTWATAIGLTLLLAAANLAQNWDGMSNAEAVASIPATPANAVEGAAEITDIAPQVLQASIAVLPFVNMSNDPEQEFFSDGLSEDILNGLVKFSDLKVVARTSSFSFKGRNVDIREIGQILNVSYVLEGSVRKVGNKVRVTAQLIAANDGSHVWSEQYNRELTDVFVVQDEVTTAILQALNQNFEAPNAIAEPTENTAAYNALLRARYHGTRLQFAKTAAAISEAIELDPEYADAYGFRAGLNNTAVWWSVASASKTIPLIKADTDRVLELDPGNVGGRTSRAMMKFYADGDYQAGLDEIHALYTRYPNDGNIIVSYMTMLQTVDRYEEAVLLARRGLELDPLSPAAHRQLAEQLSYVGEFEEAKIHAAAAEDLGLPVALLLAQMAFAEQDEAALDIQLARDTSQWGAAPSAHKLFRAIRAFQLGDAETTLRLFAELKESEQGANPRTTQAIKLYAGDIDGALDDFEYLMEEKDFWTMRAARGTPTPYDSAYNALRNSPRYLAILQHTGLDDSSVAQLQTQPLNL
jgi:adenylate cyclase